MPSQDLYNYNIETPEEAGRDQERKRKRVENDNFTEMFVARKYRKTASVESKNNFFTYTGASKYSAYFTLCCSFICL